jgi:transportin-1
MRSISCWALGRYCSWLFDPNNDSGLSLFQAALSALIDRMGDPTPKVQASACSALCVLSEAAGEEMTPYLPNLLSAAHHCFPIYGVKSTMHLVDLIGCVADSVGEEMSSPQLSPLYLPSIMHLLRQMDDADMYIFPILECLTSVTSAAGEEMAPYAVELSIRCLRIINNTLMSNAAVETGAAYDDSAPVKDFAICGIDVLSGLFEGLGNQFLNVIVSQGQADTLLSLLFASIQDTLPELRQSSILLAGEICKSAPSLLAPPVRSRLMELFLLNLDESYPPVCSNAVWALGEMTVQVILCCFINIMIVYYEYY